MTPSARSPARPPARRPVERCCAEPASARSGLAALGRLTPVARGAVAPRIVIVGAGLAGLTCAYRLKQAGYAAEVYEASDRIGGRCWTLARRVRRRADRRARRRADRPGPHRDPQARPGARAQPRQPASGRGERHRAVRLLRRSAVHVRRDHRRPQGDLAEDPRGRLGRELPDAVRQLHAARLRARPHVDHRLDRARTFPAGRLAARPAARRRLQHRVRRRVARRRARSTCCTCSATRGRASCGSSASRTRSTTSAAATTRSRRGSRPRLAGQITTGCRAGRGRAQRRRRVHADVRRGPARRP